MEIGFVFDTLDATGGEQLTGPNPPHDLAHRMHAAWVAFARTGDPGWPAFDNTYPVKTFGGDHDGEIVNDPRHNERTAWDWDHESGASNAA
jgi:para-nitrobenzyl esterase